jgi:phage terminase large subunit
VTTAKVELPPKLIPVFLGEADFRGAWGGRGSGKSRSFAKMAAIKGYQWAKGGKSGVIVCGREYQNSLAESSMSEVKAAIESEPWLAAFYDIGESYIRTRDGRIDFAFVGLRHNLASIKSKARILLLWVDEAEYVQESAWVVAIPTVREEGSEIWVTWNPERKGSPTDLRFRQATPHNSKIVELNYRDNPWFPDKLDRQRLEDFEQRPDSYAHIWEGDYKTANSGAYYAKQLAAAKAEGRIGNVARDPLMTVRAHCDIGGTGAKADAFAMWLDQFVGREIRVLDYYEVVGQPLATHAQWLRDNGYAKAQIVLPHDGAAHDKVYAVSYESAFRAAGFDVRVIPNMGRGAATTRIEQARRLFSSMWFDADKTEAGRDAIGWYHEKIDENRNIGLGPDHDWSSHGADAFGLMAVDYYSTSHDKPNMEALMHYEVDY